MAYNQSVPVKDAKKKLDEKLAQKPGSYSSAWAGRADAALDAMESRKPFSYDLGADALYRQYRDQYIRQGKRAMEDTMGAAAGLTGGYGNSYAETAGQQSYQNYLTQLSDVVPELYRLALDRYTREGDDMQQQFENLTARENQDYSRYQDALAAWRSDRDYLAGDYRDQRDFDFGLYTDQRDFDYQKTRDAEDDRRWQAEFDYRAAKDAMAAAAKSGRSGGGSSKKKKTVTLPAPAASAVAGGTLGLLALRKGATR